jgi:hypothetical protein
VHRPTSCTVGSGIPSHIPVRSPGHVIKRRGDGQMFKKGHKHATTEFSEANGGVPPKIHLPKPEFASESVDVPSVRGLLFPRFLSRSHASSFQGAMTIYRTLGMHTVTVPDGPDGSVLRQPFPSLFPRHCIPLDGRRTGRSWPVPSRVCAPVNGR